MAGPWTRLTDAKLKKLALDVARVWAEYGGEGLLQAVGMAVKDSEMEMYWARDAL